MHELFKRHRPKKLVDVWGNQEAKSTLQKFINKKSIPHAILLHGSTGTGKTTIARILTRALKCDKTDLREINCADKRGIELIRGIINRKGYGSLKGREFPRVYILDECGEITPQGQKSLLKLVEDTPSHIYFILATTDPQQLIAPLKNRCTIIALRPLTDKEMEGLIHKVLQAEGRALSEEVIERVVQSSEGSARRALVIVNQIIDLESDEEQLDAVERSDSKRKGIEIAQALLYKRPKWSQMAELLKSVDEEPETIRQMILTYMNSVMLKSGGKNVSRANLIIATFEDRYFHKSGLTSRCYEILTAK